MPSKQTKGFNWRYLIVIYIYYEAKCSLFKCGGRFCFKLSVGSSTINSEPSRKLSQYNTDLYFLMAPHPELFERGSVVSKCNMAESVCKKMWLGNLSLKKRLMMGSVLPFSLFVTCLAMTGAYSRDQSVKLLLSRSYIQNVFCVAKTRQAGLLEWNLMHVTTPSAGSVAISYVRWKVSTCAL